MLKYYCANIALLEDKEKFDFWMEQINTKRREKVLRCKNQKDKERSLLAGVLLRYGLENEGISYESVTFSKTENGKPIVISAEPIHFNISHAGDYVVCVMSDEEVGIDIECTDKHIFTADKEQSLVSMARKCLSDAEWTRFKESAKKPEAFMEYWTKKEAYSKCSGLGLRADFSSIDTENSTEKFWSTWMEDGYCISIYRENGAYEELMIENVDSI